MNSYIIQLKDQLAQYEAQCGVDEPFSILELLWGCYSCGNPVDDGQIRQAEAALAPVFSQLSAKNADTLFDLISDLITAYQRSALFEGILIGVHLTEELG